MNKIFPRIIKTAIISLVLHYLFVMYFPIDWLEKIAIINNSGTQKNGGKSNSFEFELLSKVRNDLPFDKESAVNEQEQQNTDGQSKSSEGTGLEGVDTEKWGDLIESLEKNTGFTQGYENNYEDLIKNSKVSNKYIHRDRNHEDIVIKEVFPTIHSINESFEDLLKIAPQQLNEFESRNKIIEQYRNPKGGEERSFTVELPYQQNQKNENLGALDFPPDERQTFFDETIKLDKSEQLSGFIAKYFDYDPNEGDLPVATRELYAQNLERLLYTFSTDPSYFYLDFYLENLNKEEFLQNALYQASRLNGSKTATELLFSIEAIYEIQQRTWRSYFDFEELYQSLPEERKNRLRIETIRRVNERYKEVLQEKGIKDLSDLENKYRQRRLEIINHIINNTPDGYRLQDAKFNRGVVLWEMGMKNNDADLKQQAVTQWQSLIGEVKENRYSESLYKDFNNLEHISLLDALLMAYQQDIDARKTIRENQISDFLLQRQNKRLDLKYKREEKLLWPNN